MSKFEIPAGYVKDADGNLIKEENLTAQQREEDALWPRAKALHDEIARFKYDSMKAVEDLVERMIRNHGIKKFERIQGNVQFITVDGQYRVQRAIDKLIEVDSSIEVARQKFTLYLQAIQETAGKDAGEFLDNAFDMKDGKVNVARLIDICNKDIKHPLYISAVQALRKAMFVSGTKAYLRFYQRNKDNGWDPMPLQFSSIEPQGPEESANDEATQATAEA
ncbi:DUF3164 family protein [Bowmanella dokdonensis]|uniref:DUF3164 family protein n=1 Tax=Bowmanella dokdonensis TaxID=751969 RepID=A0A939DLN0_9ALTE|nr:DUF3164 family protein [Bowmanella dokdonensis]MBN7824753.1 DUF3164 family protein [Bowmanella dokdonensis]